MRIFIPMLMACVLAMTTLDAGAEIRGFEVKIIESLGKELYQRDLLAARGTDLLFEKFPEAREGSIRGWITEIGKAASHVYFLGEKDSKVSLAYTIVFPTGETPVVEDKSAGPVPEEILLRYRARKTAIEAIPGFAPRPYNFEVLDDPHGEGFLVYALASTKEEDEIVVGGHYRVSVTRDGSKATAVDALSKSLLILSKRPKDLPKDSEMAGYSMSHIVSATPVETHVFLSLQNDKPFYIATGEDVVWKVEGGKLSKADPKE